jgi:hypothetical protein
MKESDFHQESISCNILKEINLRGYAFEHIAQILLRRKHKNNFIFQTKRFDNLEEIERKYRLNFDEKTREIKKLLLSEGGKCDLIEFKLGEQRIVEKIILFEVKTLTEEKNFVESCLSNHNFMKKAGDIKETECILVKIALKPDWEISLEVDPYYKQRVRTYTRFSRINFH